MAQQRVRRSPPCWRRFFGVPQVVLLESANRKLVSCSQHGVSQQDGVGGLMTKLFTVLKTEDLLEEMEAYWRMEIAISFSMLFSFSLFMFSFNSLLLMSILFSLQVRSSMCFANGKTFVHHYLSPLPLHVAFSL